VKDHNASQETDWRYGLENQVLHFAKSLGFSVLSLPLEDPVARLVKCFNGFALLAGSRLIFFAKLFFGNFPGTPCKLPSAPSATLLLHIAKNRMFADIHIVREHTCKIPFVS
jgi:hypothetical protein